MYSSVNTEGATEGGADDLDPDLVDYLREVAATRPSPLAVAQRRRRTRMMTARLLREDAGVDADPPVAHHPATEPATPPTDLTAVPGHTPLGPVTSNKVTSNDVPAGLTRQSSVEQVTRPVAMLGPDTTPAALRNHGPVPAMPPHAGANLPAVLLVGPRDIATVPVAPATPAAPVCESA